ncbi:hypothetical protein ACFRFC_37645, partial [Streptomyces sp. NPDC056734]|uniref:hypothetical protein n=1 Tax=Streptomyces sp. NPDC056734 TaxID=3345931 RepID=UPI00369FC278
MKRMSLVFGWLSRLLVPPLAVVEYGSEPSGSVPVASAAVLVRPYLPVSEAAQERERQRIRDWQEKERQRLRRQGLALALQWRAADGPVGPMCGD